MRKKTSAKLLLASGVMLGFFNQGVQALGLGKITVTSALNQPLSAQIALTSVRPGETDEMLVKLASEQAFSQAGVDRPFYLTRLRFNVVTNTDGTKAIQITSDQPVKEPFLSFLVDVDWTRGRLVREYTVLLDPPVYTTRNNERLANTAPVPVTAPQVATPSTVPPALIQRTPDVDDGTFFETEAADSEYASRFEPVATSTVDLDLPPLDVQSVPEAVSTAEPAQVEPAQVESIQAEPVQPVIAVDSFDDTEFEDNSVDLDDLDEEFYDSLTDEDIGTTSDVVQTASAEAVSDDEDTFFVDTDDIDNSVDVASDDSLDDSDPVLDNVSAEFDATRQLDELPGIAVELDDTLDYDIERTEQLMTAFQEEDQNSFFAEDDFFADQAAGDANQPYQPPEYDDTLLPFDTAADTSANIAAARPATDVDSFPQGVIPEDPVDSYEVTNSLSIPNEYTVERGDTLGEIAARLKGSDVNINQAMIAILRNNPEAFVNNNINRLRTGAVLRYPADTAINARAALTEVQAQNSVWREYRDTLIAAQSQVDNDFVSDNRFDDVDSSFSDEPRDDLPTEQRLALVAPAEDAEAAREASGQESDTAGSLVDDDEAFRLQEDLAAQQLEREELESRLSDLEQQQETMQRIAELENQRLAELQAQAGDLNATDADITGTVDDPEIGLVPPEQDDLSSNAVFDEIEPEIIEPEMIEPGIVDSGVTPESDLESGLAPEIAEATVETVEPVVAESNAPSVAVGSEGLLSQARQFVFSPAGMGISGGLLALLIGLGVYLFKRKKDDDEFDFVADPAFDDETAIVPETNADANADQPGITEVDAQDDEIRSVNDLEVTAQEPESNAGLTEPNVSSPNVSSIDDLPDTVQLDTDKDAAAGHTTDHTAKAAVAALAVTGAAAASRLSDDTSGNDAPMSYDLDSYMEEDPSLMQRIKGLFSRKKKPEPSFEEIMANEPDQNVASIPTEDDKTSIQPQKLPTHEQVEPPEDIVDAPVTANLSEAAKQTDTEAQTSKLISVEEDNAIIEEANVYLNYNLYDQAEEVLQGAIKTYPDHVDYQAKLLEVYYTVNNQPAFVEHAQKLHDQLNGRQHVSWDKAVAMGQEIAPDNPLFADATTPLDVDTFVARGDNDNESDKDAAAATAAAAGAALAGVAANAVSADSSPDIDLTEASPDPLDDAPTDYDKSMALDANGELRIAEDNSLNDIKTRADENPYPDNVDPADVQEFDLSDATDSSDLTDDDTAIDIAFDTSSFDRQTLLENASAVDEMDIQQEETRSALSVDDLVDDSELTELEFDSGDIHDEISEPTMNMAGEGDLSDSAKPAMTGDDLLDPSAPESLDDVTIALNQAEDTDAMIDELDVNFDEATASTTEAITKTEALTTELAIDLEEESEITMAQDFSDLHVPDDIPVADNPLTVDQTPDNLVSPAAAATSVAATTVAATSVAATTVAATAAIASAFAGDAKAKAKAQEDPTETDLDVDVDLDFAADELGLNDEEAETGEIDSDLELDIDLDSDDDDSTIALNVDDLEMTNSHIIEDLNARTGNFGDEDLPLEALSEQASDASVSDTWEDADDVDSIELSDEELDDLSLDNNYDDTEGEAITRSVDVAVDGETDNSEAEYAHALDMDEDDTVVAGDEDLINLGDLGMDLEGDEVETKLDLARAYIGIGDSEGAASTLDEVMSEGDETQRKQAEELREELESIT